MKGQQAIKGCHKVFDIDVLIENVSAENDIESTEGLEFGRQRGAPIQSHDRAQKVVRKAIESELIQHVWEISEHDIMMPVCQACSHHACDTATRANFDDSLSLQEFVCARFQKARQ